MNEILEDKNSDPAFSERKLLNLPLLMIGILILFLIGGGIFLYVQQNSVGGLSQNESLGIQPGNVSRTMIDENCDIFSDKLDSCTEYKCQFTHPLTGDLLIKEIVELKSDGKCVYVEEMPNGGKMKCEYTESMRKAIVQYYNDLKNSESSGAEINFTSNGNLKVKYTIDGKEVENPLQEALNNGQCVISGYDY